MFMKKYIIIITLSFFIVSIANEEPSSEVLWNDECPSAVSENAQEREALKKEIQDFESGLRSLLDLPIGHKISEPNEKLQNEIILTERIIKEVFKPGVIPLESIKDKFLLSYVNLKGSEEQVLFFRVKQDKYIVQFMKRTNTIFITIRPISGQTIEIPKLAEDIFNNRILPVKWDKAFYMTELKRDSKIIRAGQWITRDHRRVTPSGEIYEIDQFFAGIKWYPLGEGLYSQVSFRTDGKFAIFSISGGPKPLQKDRKGYPGSAGTGENIKDQ